MEKELHANNSKGVSPLSQDLLTSILENEISRLTSKKNSAIKKMRAA
jgi:hypothetical protein